MGRHKAAKSCTILPWLSAKADNAESRFVQAGNSLMLSPRFQRLSAGARVLYLSMCMDSAGRREFTFTLSSARKYGFPQTSFRRYVEELIEESFLERESGANARLPNLYRFNLRWKD